MNKQELNRRRREALKRIGMLAGATAAIAVGSTILAGCNGAEKEADKQELALNAGPAAYTCEFPVAGETTPVAETAPAPADSEQPNQNQQAKQPPANKSNSENSGKKDKKGKKPAQLPVETGLQKPTDQPQKNNTSDKSPIYINFN